MSCLRGTPCCSKDVTSLYIPARRSADGWLRSKFFKTSAREKVSTYITWVNNQLARNPHTHPISTLERGISDGVTLPHLLHILGDEPVPDVSIPPTTDAVRKQNIRLCFQYLQQRHIHPRNSTAPDVSNGNLKCIMRLLLALAANFKTYRADNRILGYSTSLPANEVVCNGITRNTPEQDEVNVPGSDMTWMYDQVIDTRKQIESLKHLLLKDITDDEKVMLDNVGVELTPPSCSLCQEQGDKANSATHKIKSLEEMLNQREKQMMELKAEILHLKTRDKYLANELDGRNVQISKLKVLIDKKQSTKSKEESKSRCTDKKQWSRDRQEPPTKLLYYLGSSSTPYLSQTNKKLGEITLRDFKNIINRSGRFRYNFKCFDKEFGAVKEEISEEGTLLPGWDGRIVGFLEEQATSLDQIEI